MKTTIEMPIEELKVGDCTAAPIITENGVCILEAEVVLTAVHIASLLKKNIKTVVIEKEQKYTAGEVAVYKEQLIVNLRKQFKYYKEEDTVKKNLIKLLYRHFMHKYES